MNTFLLAEIPFIPPDQVGQWILCLVLVAYLATLVKKLFGWESTEESLKRDVTSLKRKVEDLASKTATRDELEKISAKCDNLERYTRDRTHDTIKAVGEVQLNLEKMRTEFIKEMRATLQPLEDRLNEFIIDWADGHGTKKRGG